MTDGFVTTQSWALSAVRDPDWGQFSDDFQSVMLGYELNGRINMKTIPMEGMDSSFDQAEVMHEVICQRNEIVVNLHNSGLYPLETS